MRRLRARALRRLRGEQDPDRLRALGVQLGRNVHLGSETLIDPSFPWLISVGDDTTIAARVHILAHDASIKLHLGYSTVEPVRIGSRVYIGANAVVLPGVTIGDRAIVGAGSVVRRDVPPGAIAVGAPARVVGTTDELVARHAKLMRERPVFPDRGWTVGTGVTHANRRAMLARLQDGAGYVR